MNVEEMWVWARGRVLTQSNETKWRDLFASVGFTDVVFVLNDFGFDDFGTFQSPQRIYDVARRYQDIGIRTHVLSWIKPVPGFVRAAADVLIPLCERSGMVSLQWDVEEYWTQHTADHAQVAHEVVAPAFAGLSCPMGVTGITSLKSKVKPLVAISRYAVPQAYSFPTRTGDDWHAPGLTQRLADKFWGPLQREMVMGLACYKQGSSRSAARRAMSTCIKQSLALGHRRLCYWDCLPVQDNGVVREYLAEIGRTVVSGPSFLARSQRVATLTPGGFVSPQFAQQATSSAVLPLAIGGAVLGAAALGRLNRRMSHVA